MSNTGPLIYKCSVPGRCPSKKNTQKVVRRHGMTFVVYTPLFRAWESEAIAYMKAANKMKKPFGVPMVARFTFYFKNHSGESDTSNLVEAPQDVLKKAGVIADDKFIYLFTAHKVFGTEPRTDIELYHYEEPTP